MAFSEPGVTGTLYMLHNKLSAADFEQLTRHVINMLCKPVHSKRIDAYVIKLMLQEMAIVPKLKTFYPEALFVFMYRDGLQVAQSLAKISKVKLVIIIIISVY